MISVLMLLMESCWCTNMMKKLMAISFSLLLVLSALTSSHAEGVILNVYGKDGAGEWDNPLLKKQHPEITWFGSYTFSGNADTLAQALAARQPYDIYALNYTEQNFTEIVQKGFAADLSGYPALANYAARMRPYLREALTFEEKLYGVPIRLSTSMWAYSPETFALVGMEETDVPQTYAQFLDLLDWWIEEDQELDVQFLRGAYDLRSELANIITKELIVRYDASDEPEPFYSPQILEIYEKLDSLDTTKLDTYLSSLEEGDSYGKPTLFALSFDGLEVHNYEENADFTPISLRVREKEQVRVPVEMRLFFISADSENADTAALYLDAYLRGLDESFPIVSQTGPHAPIENPRAKEQIDLLLQERISLEAALEQPDADTADITQRLERNQLYMERAERQRTLVPQKNIDRLDFLESSLYVPAYSPLGSIDSEGYRSIQMLIDQYAARQIDATTLLRSIDQKIAMIALEGT